MRPQTRYIAGFIEMPSRNISRRYMDNSANALASRRRRVEGERQREDTYTYGWQEDDEDRRCIQRIRTWGVEV
jgi:hypothetical protein